MFRLTVLAGLLAGAVAFVRPQSSLPTRRATLRMAAGEHALIIQNKGGGHGEIGYHLALNLAKEKGMKVTILNDKYSESKEPFKSYGKLKDLGVDIIAAELATADVTSLLASKKFEYVYDNYAKNADLAKPVAELALAQSWPVKTYVFVSSGGMYEVGDQFPLVEGDAVKDSNDARQIEKYLASTGLPYTFFRPQYIYGPLTNKRDYLDWFFDRVARGRTLPLPKHGDQFTTLTHVEDIASLLASVVDNAKAVNQVFNAASDRYVTFKEVGRLVGKAVGKDVSFATYEPSKHKETLPKGWWPFRNTHFNVSPEKAKLVLGWKPKHDLATDLQDYYKGYVAAGLDKKDIAFEVDDKILA